METRSIDNPRVSIIIAIRQINDYLREHLPRLLELDYPNFEILIHVDKEKPRESWPKTKIFYEPEVTSPPKKRNRLVKASSGEIIAFIDDDAYPQKDWVKKAVPWFKNKKIAGVGGPNLTHPKDNLLQRVSGLAWGSKFGNGGSGLNRVRQVPSARGKELDDWQSVNLFTRKEDFLKVGGFAFPHYPGEDTKLCLDLVYKLKKKIIYDPDVVVYHHRRPIFKGHLRQVGTYGRHRGYFAKLYPETSRKLGYFLPSLFLLGLILGAPLSFLNPLIASVYLYIISLYLILLFLSGIEIFLISRSLLAFLLVVPTIFLTHIWYGTTFLKGVLSKNYVGRGNY